MENSQFVSISGHYRDGKWKIAVAYEDGVAGLGLGPTINDALTDACRNAGRPWARAKTEA